MSVSENIYKKKSITRHYNLGIEIESKYKGGFGKTSDVGLLCSGFNVGSRCCGL